MKLIFIKTTTENRWQLIPNVLIDTYNIKKQWTPSIISLERTQNIVLIKIGKIELFQVILELDNITIIKWPSNFDVLTIMKLSQMSLIKFIQYIETNLLIN